MLSLFPTIIHEMEVSNFDKERCIKEVKKIKEKDPIGAQRSNMLGYQSKFIQGELHDYFNDMIFKTLSNYFQKEKIYKPCEIINHGYWVNINPPNAYNNAHSHPNSDLAGVIWIETDEKTGSIWLRNPNHFAEYSIIENSMKSFAEKHGIHNAFRVKTPPGGCLLFPSHIDHWVDQNKSTKDRISISFNLELNY